MTGVAMDVRGLTRRFGRFVAVREVTFDVRRGEIFGYLGANGAGKSTTIRMLCGLLAPSGGSATVNGIDVARDPEGVKRSLGYMSQKFSLYMDLSVEENLEFFGGAQGLGGRALGRRIGEVLEAVEMGPQRSARTGTLPGGLRQRVALASALLHAPPILFLDEPTAGVDPAARRMFWVLIRRLAAAGTTIFVTTHYMDEAEGCDRIGLMVDGRLVALDAPAALKRDRVPGQIFRIEGERVSETLALLSGSEGVLEVHPFGSALHARVDPGRLDAARLAALVPGVRIAAIAPTLEDVFLAVVEGGA